MAFRRFRARRPVPKRIKSVFGRATPSLFRGVKLRYVWNGDKVIADLNEGAQRALKRAEGDAQQYWDDVVWQPQLHPYATGNEQGAVDFNVTRSARNRAHFTGAVDLGIAPESVYHEFGTADYEGHFPLRQTMDFIAPRIRQYLIEELRRDG